MYLNELLELMICKLIKSLQFFVACMNKSSIHAWNFIFPQGFDWYMIRGLVSEFDRHNRYIYVVVGILNFLLFVMVGCIVYLVYARSYERLLSLIAPLISLLAALLVARVANRLIINGDIIREDDRRQEIVRTTHHLIAVVKDLKLRVGYVKSSLLDGGRPNFAIVEMAKTIESRYESLLNREVYKVLPGGCIDIISRISGGVYGISLLASGFNRVAAKNPDFAMAEVSIDQEKFPAEVLDKLMQDLQILIDELFKIREGVDE